MPEDDEDVSAEVRERRAMTLSEMARLAKPGDRWPYEPPSGAGDDDSGDREPRQPQSPLGSASALASTEEVELTEQ